MNGQSLYAGGVGRRDLSSVLPAQQNTVYSIASVNKQFIAALTLKLEADGKLSIDDPLARYAPNVPLAEHIRLEHLLTNTSGIVSYTELLDFPERVKTKTTPEEIIASCASQGPIAAPGTLWHYSNTNYVLLSWIAQRVTDTPISDLFSSYFFEPLELASTSCDSTSLSDNGLAIGYSSIFLGEPERVIDWNESWLHAGGAIYSTVDDLVLWAGALRSGKAIGLPAYERMIQPAQIQGAPYPYGYGLHIDELRGYKQVHHAGMLPGFVSELTSIPELDLDVAVLTNQDMANPVSGFVEPLAEVLMPEPSPVREDGSSGNPRVFRSSLEAADIERLSGELLAGQRVPSTAAFDEFLTDERRQRLRDLRLHDVGLRYFRRSSRPPLTTYLGRVERSNGTVFEMEIGILDGKAHTLAIKPWTRSRDLKFASSPNDR
jgi:D-alanyl-D-alanine carboxypeptidase